MATRTKTGRRAAGDSRAPTADRSGCDPRRDSLSSTSRTPGTARTDDARASAASEDVPPPPGLSVVHIPSSRPESLGGPSTDASSATRDTPRRGPEPFLIASAHRGTATLAPGECGSVLEYWEGGRAARLRYGTGARPETEQVRGRVRGFSRASRLRLLRWVGSLDLEELGPGSFVTLTMPGSWYPGCDTPSDWKRHLDVWLHRLRRFAPKCWGVWRLEPQRRGAPHFHLLLWGLPANARAWVARSWWEVVGSEEETHLQAGTRTEWIRTTRGTMWYAAKYCAKVVTDHLPGWDAVGRWWGVHRRCESVRKPRSVCLDDGQWLRLRRVFRAFAKSRGVRRRVPADGATVDKAKPWRSSATVFLAPETIMRLLAWAANSST